ncbi:MAG: hypothetical protein U0792_13535 [Gemmataceae bacterium]
MSELRFNLDLIEVPIPCTVPWESMRGYSRVRYCDQCKQNVYQLSEMSRDEAEALIKQKEGKLCVRFFRRPDGTVVTRDCKAVRWSRAVWRAGVFVAFGLVAVLLSPVAPTLYERFQEWREDRGIETQGDICPPRGHPVLELAPPPREVSDGKHHE